jgi:hypothetical protein
MCAPACYAVATTTTLTAYNTHRYNGTEAHAYCSMCIHAMI